jgi:hypothetical protein
MLRTGLLGQFTHVTLKDQDPDLDIDLDPGPEET